MQKFLFFAGLTAFFFSCTNTKNESVQSTPSSFLVDRKKAVEYTTADITNLRLAMKVELAFKQKGQPFENEISVFVDPTKTYQEFMGVGAALTDASAETFATMEKQLMLHHCHAPLIHM